MQRVLHEAEQQDVSFFRCFALLFYPLPFVSFVVGDLNLFCSRSCPNPPKNTTKTKFQQLLRQLQRPIRRVSLRHMQPMDVERGASVPLSRLRILPRRRGRELPTLHGLRDVHRPPALLGAQLQGRQVHEQLPRMSGGPLLEQGRQSRATVRSRHTLALLPRVGGSRQPVSSVQEDGRDAREDEAHVGRHGDGHRPAAGAAGYVQGRDDHVQRLRGGAAESGVALPRRAVSALR